MNPGCNMTRNIKKAKLKPGKKQAKMTEQKPYHTKKQSNYSLNWMFRECRRNFQRTFRWPEGEMEEKTLLNGCFLLSIFLK